MSESPATFRLKEKHDYLAPDGSEIWLLANARGGGIAMCTCPVGVVSKPVVHRTVEEIWYFLEGRGVVWRRPPQGEAFEVEVGPDDGITIPVGTAFQFRSTGDVPLKFLIVTMPPWPGPQEAVPAPGRWNAS